MALLAVETVSVRFGGLNALDQVELDAAEGQVTGLIGPNGAGKTTLFNVICGLEETNSGRVVLDGRNLAKLKAHRRARLGLGRTFQRLEVFGSLTARENILAAAEIHRRWSHKRTKPRQVADELVERVGLAEVAEEPVDRLPTGMARLVEVARALAAQPRMLLLDEPSSGLDENETDDFAKLLVNLAGDGLGILMVEHDVALVMQVCERIHVLDFGSMIAAGTPEEIRQNADVQAAYLGAEASGDNGSDGSGDGSGDGGSDGGGDRG